MIIILLRVQDPQVNKASNAFQAITLLLNNLKTVLAEVFSKKDVLQQLGETVCLLESKGQTRI